jgi:hypothetical protein
LTIRHLVFSAGGHRLLNEAIVAAGLPKKERLPSFEDYTLRIERNERQLERDAIMFQRRVVPAQRMLDWLDDHGLLPDERGRRKYTRVAFGEDPVRRRFRRRGMLMAWGSGPDSHMDGPPEASVSSDWHAKVMADRRPAYRKDGHGF